jgi:hypothetical protein
MDDKILDSLRTINFHKGNFPIKKNIFSVGFWPPHLRKVEGKNFFWGDLKEIQTYLMPKMPHFAPKK